MTDHKIKTVFSYDTEYCADSVEWCPHENLKNIFVCANYQLLDSGKRVGRILLFSATPQNGLELLQTIDTAAVLDQKWCTNKINNLSLLCVVNAKNSIEVYTLNKEKLQLELLTSYELSVEETETLILSLDWSTGKYSSEEPELICSTSKGDILLLKLINQELILQQLNKSHEFEAWIVGFYYWDKNIFFSGGDDSIFFKYDKRTGNEPIAKNKTHNAGVTSLHSNISKEFIIASGSYDEYVRIWDLRKFKEPVSDSKMPGPLWRLKWDPFVQKYLLSACMLGGVHILDVKNVESPEICESYYEHKNIAYGADWCHLKDEELENFQYEGNCLIGSCSFYDHLLCVSKLQIKL